MKKKRRIQVPPLSRRDKGIYNCLMAVSVVVGLFLYVAMSVLFRASAFRDTHILALRNPTETVFAVLGAFWGLACVYGLCRLTSKRQPILGRTSAEFRPPQWKEVDPLLHKRFWKKLFSDKKRLMWTGLCVFSLILVFVFVFVLGLLPRQCLYDDGSVSVYNCFNKQTKEYNRSDIAEVNICTAYYPARRSVEGWGVEIKIVMEDGADFVFRCEHLRLSEADIRGAIAGMHQIKSCFDPRLITVSGKDKLPEVIRNMHLNEQQAELLYALFEAETPPQ